MNTPAHLLLGAVALGRGGWRAHWPAICAGALVPDLPMLGFYAWQRGVVGAPEAWIWSQGYFDPGWQLLFDVFNSIPLVAVGALVAWRAGSQAGLAFFASMALHCLADLPLHHDDAHRHFLPLSGWRFESPVSYWDPGRFGRWTSLLEMLFVLGAGGWLALRGATRAWRVVGVLAALGYAAYAAFAVVVWRWPGA